MKPLLRVGFDSSKNEPGDLTFDQVALLDRYNIEFVPMNDFRPMHRRADGSWSGGLGHLANGTVDTLASNIFITQERYESFAFSSPFKNTDYVLLYASANPLHFDSLFARIDLHVYLTTAIVCVLLIALYQFARPTMVGSNVASE